MTQIVNEREDPLNLGGGGWAASIPARTWSSSHRRRRGAPKAMYEAPRKKAKQQHGPGPWFQPPLRPYWAVYSNWGRYGEPWRPPPMAFQSPLCPAQMIRAYGLHPLCLCCCPCWSGPWNPGWARPPGRKKRWGHRSRGLRRHPRRCFSRNPPVDLSKLLRPVNLNGWRAPGMRAPRNTTQFIMNQVYEDMRQQEKLERQQAALRAQQAQAPRGAPMGSIPEDQPPSCAKEDLEWPEHLFSFPQDPSLAFSPAPMQPSELPTPQMLGKDDVDDNDDYDGHDDCDEGVCDKEEESQEEDGETEDEDEEEEEGEETYLEKDREETLEEEGVEEEGQREEDKFLPLGMPLSVLVGEEDDGENFINYDYLSAEQIIPKVPEEDLFLVPDINP